MSTIDINQIREKFNQDRFATLNGCYIEEFTEEYVKCSLKIEEKHLNARNFVMGGAIFTLADFTFAVATNSLDQECVSLSSQIAYLSPAKGDTLYAVATPIKKGRSTCYYEIIVTDANNRKVAHVTTNGFIV